MLAARKINKPEPMWLAELAGATLAIDRVGRGEGARASAAGRRAERALADALERDKFWAVRGAAAAGLAQIRNDAARDRLIKRLAPRSIRARAARSPARSATSCTTHTPAPRSPRSSTRATPSYFVEAEACLALGKTRHARAGELLRKAATRDSYTDVIRQHAYRGLAEARDDSALGLLADGDRAGATPRKAAAPPPARSHS